MERPSAVILSGPNGAGKSTLAPLLLRGRLGVTQFVNADMIASGLSGFSPESTAIAAGRIMLKRLRTLANARESFAFETTLASRAFAPWLASLRDQGYGIHLVYLWLPSADVAIARVRSRVEAGGHGIPEATVRRRYLSGLRNLFQLYQSLTDTWRVYDSSGHPVSVASGAGSQVLTVDCAASWRLIRETVDDEV
jgi:predicted ABC-type ATPase